MPYTKITLEMGATVNIGNFQNVRFGQSIEYVLEPGETLAEARLKVSRDLREAVLDEMQPALRVVSAYERDRWTQVVDAPASAEANTFADRLFPTAEAEIPAAGAFGYVTHITPISAEVDTLHNGDEEEDDGLGMGDQVVYGFDDESDEDDFDE